MKLRRFALTVFTMTLIPLSGQPASSIIDLPDGEKYLSPDLEYGTEYSWVVTKRENIETEFREIEDNYIFGSNFFIYTNPDVEVDLPKDDKGSVYSIILGQEFASQQIPFNLLGDEKTKWFTDNFSVKVNGEKIDLALAFELNRGLRGFANYMVRTFFTPFLVNDTGTYNVFEEYIDDPEICFDDPILENCDSLVANVQFAKDEIIQVLLERVAEGNYTYYVQVLLDGLHHTVNRYFENDHFVVEDIMRICDQEICNNINDLSLFFSYIETWEATTGVLLKSSIQRVWFDDPDPFVEDDETKYTEKFELTNKVYLDNNKQNDGFLSVNNAFYSLFFGFGILVIFRKNQMGLH